MPKKPKKFIKKKSISENGKEIHKSPSARRSKSQNDKQKQSIQAKKEFPKIPRFIPELPRISLEKLHWPSFTAYGKSLRKYSKTKLLFAGVLLLFALLLSGFVAISLYTVYTSWSQEMGKRQQLYAEMQLWDNITKTYPTYPDAYFKGALIAYELGDKGKVEYFLSKLHLVDPNFPLTAPLEKLETVHQLGEK